MRNLKIIFLLLLISIVSACSTTKTPDANEKKAVRIAEINVSLGMAYLGKGDVNRAKQKLLYALEKAPQLPEVWYSMAYYYETTGNKEQAKEYYLKAIHLAPERGDTLNNYGTYLCRSGDYTHAIEYFDAAIKDLHYLDTAGANENAGLCALKIPDRKLAIAYFNHALEEDPARSVSTMELTKLKNS